MKLSLYNTIFEEVFNIISANKSKANSLRISLLNTINIDNNLILEIRKCLGEFEYDLKILFDILKDLKLSIENHNNNIKDLDNTIQDESQILKESKKCNSYKSLNKFKNKLFLNNLDDSEIKDDKNKSINRTKKYSLTINICSDGSLKFSSKRGNNKKLYRSNSCKTYKGFDNSIKFDLLKDDEEKVINIPNQNKSQTKKFRNYLKNHNLNGLSFNDFKDNDNISLINRSTKSNSILYNNLTDYSTNKKNNSNENLLNNFKNDKNRRNLNSNLYNYYNNNITDDINKSFNITTTTQNDNFNDDNISKAFSSEENNNEQNSINNFLSPLKLKENNNYKYKFNNRNNKNNKKKYNNNYDYYRNNSIHDSNERNKMETNINYSRNCDEINEQKNNISYNLVNNNCNYNNSNSNYNNEKYKLNDSQRIYDNNNNEVRNQYHTNNGFNIFDDFLEEDKKKEIIKTTINLVLQDNNKLNELKNNLGDDIGEKLLRGNVNEEEIFKIMDILKNSQINLKNKNEKNLFRCSKSKYKNGMRKRLNQQNEMLLKHSLNNKGYSHKECPLELFSTFSYKNQ